MGRYLNLELGCILLLLPVIAMAGGVGKDGLPNGKPFIELQGQIVQVQGAVSTLQDQVESILGNASSFDQRLTVAEQAITSLTLQNAAMQNQIDSNATDIDSLQQMIALLDQENSNLKAQISALGAADDALQAKIEENEALISSLYLVVNDLSTLQGQITNNSALIQALQDQIAEVSELLQAKQDILNGVCPGGWALRAINPDGSIACQPAGGSSTMVKQWILWAGDIRKNSTVDRTVLCGEEDMFVTGAGIRGNIDVFQSTPTVVTNIYGETYDGWIWRLINRSDNVDVPVALMVVCIGLQ